MAAENKKNDDEYNSCFDRRRKYVQKIYKKTLKNVKNVTKIKMLNKRRYIN